MKVRKLFSLIINLVAVVASVAGFIIIHKTLNQVDFIKFFTLVTNLLIIVAGIVSIGYAIDGLSKKSEEIFFIIGSLS